MRREAGFTLIEVLVAFAIASVSLALLLRINSVSTRTVIAAEEYLIATELAQSLVDEFAVTSRTLEFTDSGLFDTKFGWDIRATEFVDRAAEPSGSPLAAIDSGSVPEQSGQLREVRVAIHWSSRDRLEHFELRTIRPYNPSDDGGARAGQGLDTRSAFLGGFGSGQPAR